MGIAIINLPFWGGLHNLFMVVLGMIYYCYTFIMLVLLCFVGNYSGPMVLRSTGPVQLFVAIG